MRALTYGLWCVYKSTVAAAAAAYGPKFQSLFENTRIWFIKHFLNARPPHIARARLLRKISFPRTTISRIVLPPPPPLRARIRTAAVVLLCASFYADSLFMVQNVLKEIRARMWAYTNNCHIIETVHCKINIKIICFSHHQQQRGGFFFSVGSSCETEIGVIYRDILNNFFFFITAIKEKVI